MDSLLGMPPCRFIGATVLPKRGVIVVTIAYRLGPFGYLVTPELTKDGWGREEFSVLSKDHGEHDVGLHADTHFCDGSFSAVGRSDGSYPDTV